MVKLGCSTVGYIAGCKVKTLIREVIRCRFDRSDASDHADACTLIESLTCERLELKITLM